MELTAEEEAMLAGERGPALRWAVRTQLEVGRFFGARRFVDVTGAHMTGDMEVMGEAGFGLLRDLAVDGTRVRVPTTTNARCVDFDAAHELRQDPRLVRREAELMRTLRGMGVALTDTCINYQTVYQPGFGEHLAWGDTGAVIYANSVYGARSNFESGPAALAAALTGRTPAYGFHLGAARRGTAVVEVDAPLADVTDWGVLGAIVGRHCNDYAAVPVLRTSRPPYGDALKHLGASLASHGSIGMFHLVGTTPEAGTVDAACHGERVEDRLEVTGRDIEGFYRAQPSRQRADVVVLTGPQLSVFELVRVAELVDGRRVHPGSRLVVTTNIQNREAARQLGVLDTLADAGAMVLTGVCFYLMAVDDMRREFGWETLVTNSAKVANIVGGYRLRPTLRRTEECVEAALTGVVRGA